MDGGWKIIWEDKQKVPYMFKGSSWISYDNTRSIRNKVSYFIYENKDFIQIVLYNIPLAIIIN